MLSYNILNEYVERLKKQDMPVMATTDNITNLTGDDIAKLRVGDVVVKQTGNQKHLYLVTYKEENVGICMTYVDAYISETVSYDCIEGVWTYNSTDIVEKQAKLTAGDNITINDNTISATDTKYTAGTGISITDGVISATSNVRKLYHHKILLYCSSGCIITPGYENHTISVILEMFTNSTNTPNLSQVFANINKEFMNGHVVKVDNTEVHEIVDTRFTNVNLANNGYVYIDVNGTATRINLSSSIQSSATSTVTSLGYDTLIE